MNKIDYLRISLIDRCNFRCQYCMPEEAEIDYILQQDLLSNDELLILLEDVFIPLGFSCFRLTGGEPLLRPGVVDLISSIASLLKKIPTENDQKTDLSLTTNGFYLADMAQALYEGGLRRINISLDSLDAAIFDQIVGHRSRTRWQRVWHGILAAAKAGFNPLKLNVVVIPGVNDHEVLDLAALSINQEWHVRFIEFMPIGNNDLFHHKGWIPSEHIRSQIREKWGLISGAVRGNGPADVWQIPGAKGTIGFISQMSECFCDRCNRMRLSADGWLRPCLLNETGQIDLKTALRSGASPTELQEMVQTVLAVKPEINFKGRDPGTKNKDGIYSRTMSQIGG